MGTRDNCEVRNFNNLESSGFFVKIFYKPLHLTIISAYAQCNWWSDTRYV